MRGRRVDLSKPRHFLLAVGYNMMSSANRVVRCVSCVACALYADYVSRVEVRVRGVYLGLRV